MVSKTNLEEFPKEYLCSVCGYCERSAMEPEPLFCCRCGKPYKHQNSFTLEKPELIPVDENELQAFHQLDGFAIQDKVMLKICKNCYGRKPNYGDNFQCEKFHQFLIPKTEETTKFCCAFQNINRKECPVCHYAFSSAYESECPICHQYKEQTTTIKEFSLWPLFMFILLVIFPIGAMGAILWVYWETMEGLFSLFLIIFPFMYVLFRVDDLSFYETDYQREWIVLDHPTT